MARVQKMQAGTVQYLLQCTVVGLSDCGVVDLWGCWFVGLLWGCGFVGLWVVGLWILLLDLSVFVYGKRRTLFNTWQYCNIICCTVYCNLTADV
jgi:hypothetical protein